MEAAVAAAADAAAAAAVNEEQNALKSCWFIVDVDEEEECAVVEGRFAAAAVEVELPAEVEWSLFSGCISLWLSFGNSRLSRGKL